MQTKDWPWVFPIGLEHSSNQNQKQFEKSLQVWLPELFLEACFSLINSQFMTLWQETITLTGPIRRGVWNVAHKFHLYLIKQKKYENKELFASKNLAENWKINSGGSYGPIWIRSCSSWSWRFPLGWHQNFVNSARIVFIHQMP